MANSLNVHVNKDPKDLYNEILSNSNDVTYGIVINQTNLLVTILDSAKGYALCLGTSEPKSDVQYRNLVQEKYFTHLSNICKNILKSFMKKSVQLQKAFLLTLQHKKQLGMGNEYSLENMCNTIKKLKLNECSPFSSKNKMARDDFDDFFETNKNDYLVVDDLIRDVNVRANDLCNNAKENVNLIFRMYKISFRFITVWTNY